VPNDPELRHRITSQHHDTKVAGHPGRWKTLELISRNYWWPQISRYVGQYTRTCDLCLRTKIQRCRPTGELHPLPIPESRWDIISVDFIGELPEAHGYDAIMNVVDSWGNELILSLPTPQSLPLELPVYSYGMSGSYMVSHASIVSDRGPQFVAEFT